MVHLITLEEPLAKVELEGRSWDAFASAETTYLDAEQKARVELDAFLRPSGLREQDQPRHVDWLPQPQTSHETVERREASELTRAMFKSWVRKVSDALEAHHENVRRS